MEPLVLRPYQDRAVREIRIKWREDVRRQVLCMPTGSGKTIVAMWLLQSAQRNGHRAYFVADRRNLVHQTSLRFTQFGVRHGVLMGQQSKRLDSPTLICSSQTLEARGFDWQMPASGLFGRSIPAPDPEFLIIDECHEKRRKVLDYALERDIPMLGLSATPFTGGLGEYYSDVVNVATTTELLRDGHLSPLHVVAPPEKEVDVDGIPLNSKGEWEKDELSGRVLKITGHVVEEWERQTQKYYGGPVQTIAFFPTVADAMDAAEKFQRAGHDFRVVHYKQSADANQEAIRRFEEGGHVGLISCVALTKGFDVPSVRCMIDAYPLRRSLSMHIQKVGRVMRTAEGKDFALLIDHAGNWTGFYRETHAFFDEGCDRLDSKALASCERNTSRTQIAELKCKACGFVWPASRNGEAPIKNCPACGAARKRPRRKLHVVDGELERVDVVDGKGRELPWEGDWWAELCKVAEAITADDDKARKIARVKYRDVFGRWPPRGARFVRTGQFPHPKVDNFSYRRYRRWKRAQLN